MTAGSGIGLGSSAVTLAAARRPDRSKDYGFGAREEPGVDAVTGAAIDAGARGTLASSQWRMRLASPRRVYLPHESSSTMTTCRAAISACMTRQRPASLM